MARQRPQTSSVFPPAKTGASESAEDELRSAIEPALRELPSSQKIDDAQSAVRFLQGLMRTGALNGHDLSAQTLAGIFCVHRNTMTKALNILVAEGYLHRRPGRPARVVSSRAVLPARQARMISFTDLAQQQGLVMTSDLIRHAPVRLGSVYLGRRARVARHLQMQDDDHVIIYSRIRRVQGESTDWETIPALAETAYFAPKRLPDFVCRDLAAGRIESISRYLKTNRIEVVNSEYRIRIAELPEPFHDEWARYAGNNPPIASLRFLRFESTTYFENGPVEYSIAYLAERLFALSTTIVDLEIRADALVRRTVPSQRRNSKRRTAR